MEVDNNNLRRKNEELVNSFREKNRQCLRTQELYDKLKRREMLGQVQSAASYAVEDTIQASAIASQYPDNVENQPQNQSQGQNYSQRPTPPLFSNKGSNTTQRPSTINHSGGSLLPLQPQPRRVNNGEAGWTGFRNQGSGQRE
jgi:E3 ubiquitin-protein ligase CCNP1IP1